MSYLPNTPDIFSQALQQLTSDLKSLHNFELLFSYLIEYKYSFALKIIKQSEKQLSDFIFIIFM